MTSKKTIKNECCEKLWKEVCDIYRNKIDGGILLHTKHILRGQDRIKHGVAIERILKEIDEFMKEKNNFFKGGI